MKAVYQEQRTFVKYDDKHYIVYLNEEIIPDYVQDEIRDGEKHEPRCGYSYQGPMADGGTLIEAVDCSRDSFINGIIRSIYSQSEEDAIKTHRLQVIGDEIADENKLMEYQNEWNLFNSVRAAAKDCVNRWLT